MPAEKTEEGFAYGSARYALEHYMSSPPDGRIRALARCFEGQHQLDVVEAIKLLPKRFPKMAPSVGELDYLVQEVKRLRRSPPAPAKPSEPRFRLDEANPFEQLARRWEDENRDGTGNNAARARELYNLLEDEFDASTDIPEREVLLAVSRGQPAPQPGPVEDCPV